MPSNSHKISVKNEMNEVITTTKTEVTLFLNDDHDNVKRRLERMRQLVSSVSSTVDEGGSGKEIKGGEKKDGEKEANGKKKEVTEDAMLTQNNASDEKRGVGLPSTRTSDEKKNDEELIDTEDEEDGEIAEPSSNETQTKAQQSSKVKVEASQSPGTNEAVEKTQQTMVDNETSTVATKKEAKEVKKSAVSLGSRIPRKKKREENDTTTILGVSSKNAAGNNQTLKPETKNIPSISATLKKPTLATSQAPPIASDNSMHSNKLNNESSNKEFKCIICYLTFDTKKDRAIHMTQCCPFKCPECNLALKSWKQCAIHLDSCCPNRGYEKSDCRVPEHSSSTSTSSSGSNSGNAIPQKKESANNNNKGKTGGKFECPKCFQRYPNWKYCYSHIQSCCPEESHKGIKKKCLMGTTTKTTQSKSSYYGGESSSPLLPKSSPSSTTRETQRENSTRYNESTTTTTSTAAAPNQHHRPSNDNARETSQRRVSNLPAWMTAKQGQDNHNTSSNTSRSSSACSENLSSKMHTSRQNHPYSPPACLSSRQPKRVSERNDTSTTDTFRSAAAETSQRKGISNLPAWMTAKNGKSDSSTTAKQSQSTNYNSSSSTTRSASSYMVDVSSRNSERGRYEQSSSNMSTSRDYSNTPSSSSSYSSSSRKRNLETNDTRDSNTSRSFGETSQRRGISNLPAWMTNNKSVSSSRDNRSTSVSNTSNSSMHSSTTRSSSACGYDDNISNRRPSTPRHDISRSSKPQPDNNGNSMHNSFYRKESDNAIPVKSKYKETSARKGISNLPAWMTTTASSNNNQPPHQRSANNYHSGDSTSDPASKRRRVDERVATYEPSSRNERHRSSHDATMLRKNTPQNSLYYSNSRETSRRRGVSNLPAWMTCKES